MVSAAAYELDETFFCNCQASSSRSHLFLQVQAEKVSSGVQEELPCGEDW